MTGLSGRRRVLGLRRAVVLALYLTRRNESQAVAVAGELFGCSQPSVSRVTRGLRPLLRAATGRVWAQARRSAILLDGLLVPTGERPDAPGMCSSKRHVSWFNVQAVADLAGPSERWAGHLQPGGPGTLADLGYLTNRVLNSTPGSGWTQS